MPQQHDSPVILVLNAGSSSIKFAVFEASATPLSRSPLWHGKVEGIGSDHVSYSESPAATAHAVAPSAPQQGDKPYHAALESIRQRVEQRLGGRPMAAVAHRVVHGGVKYVKPTRIDHEVLADLRSYIPLAPLHQPFALDAIEVFLRKHDDLPQIACFDTAFHHTMPDVETMLPLPYDAWEHGLRRFGFHGLSYEYQSIALAERYGPGTRHSRSNSHDRQHVVADPAQSRIVVAHLGSGASLCGMHCLESRTTTMGFSALDGLMMGTRCGSLDAGALIYLMEVRKLSLERVGQMLYHESGLQGVSGLSADPRILFEHEAENPRAAMALQLYCHRFVHELGGCIAALGGIDMLVFTAGIGENSAAMRARLCAPLGFLGITLDPQTNAETGAGLRQSTGLISHADSRIAVAVEPTNEEWIAARHAQALLAG